MVYKSDQALLSKETENALFVLKSSSGTWGKLERILDMTVEEFDVAAEAPCFWTSSSSAASSFSSDFDSSESEGYIWTGHTDSPEPPF